MLDSHHSQEVMSVEEHAARRREGREGEEEPSTSAPQEMVGEGEEYTSILLPVDSKERRVVLRRVSGGREGTSWQEPSSHSTWLDTGHIGAGNWQ